MQHRRRRSPQQDGGVSSLELAIIAPSLLLLIFLTIQGALYFYGRSVALQAAREGVSQLRLAQTADSCQLLKDTARATSVAYAGNVGQGAINATQAKPTCTYLPDGGSTVTVQVTGHAISLLGFTLSIDESATGQVEQFQDAG